VEASSSVSAPKVEPTTTAASPSATKSASKTSGELMKGAVIMAVMDQYKDIWLSKKPDGKIALEQMDGKICTFEISNGDVKFQQGSFAEVPGDKKKAIETKISELTSGL